MNLTAIPTIRVFSILQKGKTPQRTNPVDIRSELVAKLTQGRRTSVEKSAECYINGATDTVFI